MDASLNHNNTTFLTTQHQCQHKALAETHKTAHGHTGKSPLAQCRQRNILWQGAAIANQ